MVGECHPIRKSQQMVTSRGGELPHQIDPVLKTSLWLCCVFSIRFPSMLSGERRVCPARPTAPSPQLAAPGQGQRLGRAAARPSTQNRTVAGAGRLLWVCVGRYSVRLPGEESASMLNTPDCWGQRAPGDSTAASRVASSARQRRGQRVAVVSASLVLPSQRPSVSFTHAASTGCRPRLHGTHG